MSKLNVLYMVIIIKINLLVLHKVKMNNKLAISAELRNDSKLI